MKKLKNSIISSQTKVQNRKLKSDTTIVLHEYDDGTFSIVTASSSRIDSITPETTDKKYAYDLFRKAQIVTFGKIIQDPDTVEEV